MLVDKKIRCVEPIYPSRVAFLHDENYAEECCACEKPMPDQKTESEL
jgi:hypothetical protein